MEPLRNKIIECLTDHADNEKQLLAELNLIIQKEGNRAYSTIFQVLTSLVLDPVEAEKCWHDIISHCKNMTRIMNREVSLRTAICDYFCSVHKSLENPKVVEINIFEKTTQCSQVDALTELYNRRYFDDELVKEIARARRHNSMLSILFLDLDDFKSINDTFGHIAGDKVLKSIADIMASEKRTEDIAARYGGEEFVIISPQTGKANTLILGERIRQRVEQLQLEYEGQTIRLTISGGLASFPVDAVDALTLIKYADNALYRAKTSGKNNISLFSEDKRHYIRLDFDGRVVVTKPVTGSDHHAEISATAKNLSEAGVLIETDKPLEIGSEVQLNIELIGDSPLDIIGTVVRIETYDDDLYEIGLSFLKLGSDTKGLLSDYLVRQLKTISF
jgi:diguanylate cyclase (GGDEF)-like protein